MRVDLFDFELPEDRIALRPVEPREAARLLVVDAEAKTFDDRTDPRSADLLAPGDALVVNDTRVIPARLRRRFGRAATRSRTSRSPCTSAKRRNTLARFRPSGKAARARRHACASAKRARGVLARPARRDGRSAKAKAARSRLPSISPVRRSTRRSRVSAQMPLPPYIASKRARQTRRTSAITRRCSRARRRGRGADGGVAFHPGTARGLATSAASGCIASHFMSAPGRFCR